LVRQYVAEMGYAKILPKIYATYRNASEIDIEKLPDKFVLKTNHGCGHVFICRDKNKFDLKQCQKVLGRLLKQNFAKTMLEYHYSKIKPMIICEEYIEDGSENFPIDYKIHCFNGIPHCIRTCTGRETYVNLDHYDLQWNYLEYSKPEYRSGKKIAKPKRLDKMLRIAADLSKSFPFVRVDLYNVDGIIYFGELTFTPAAGMAYMMTEDTLRYFGDLLDLNYPHSSKSEISAP